MYRASDSLLRLLAALAWTILACLPVASAVEADAPPTQSMAWESPLLGKSISCKVHLPDSDAVKKPVVVYLENLPAPRLGKLDDEALIRGFLAQGMIVIEADYEGDPRAAAPELLPEIDRWYGYLFETKDHPVDGDWIYIVPAGYTIDRNVEVCKVLGKPVGMDVIYPSGRSDPVSLMLQITSTKDPGKWINQRAYYIYGLLTTGYAGAIMDYNGGQEEFEQYRLANSIKKNARFFHNEKRIAISGYSSDNFKNRLGALHTLLSENRIPHDYTDTVNVEHKWYTGWLGQAVDSLATIRLPAPMAGRGGFDSV